MYSEAKFCSCFRSPCPTCNGARFLLSFDDKGRENAVPCPDCEVRKRNMKLYNQAKIPSNYVFSRLDKKDRDRDNALVFDLLKTIIKNIRPHNPSVGAQPFSADHSRMKTGLVLMGPPGTGKTHLMTGFIYRCTVGKGITCLFQDFASLLSDLKDGYSQGKSEMDIIAPLLQADYLVIDEMGKGRNTEWELSILDTLISTRYNANKPIMVTSNYTDTPETTLKERILTKDRSAEEKFSMDTLKTRVGSRIYSRLQEMCFFETLGGKDRRVLMAKDTLKDTETSGKNFR